MLALFFRKVCQLKALMSIEFNRIISGFKIFVLHIRIFRLKNVVQVTQGCPILENLYEACSDTFMAFSLIDHHANTLLA